MKKIGLIPLLFFVPHNWGMLVSPDQKKDALEKSNFACLHSTIENKPTAQFPKRFLPKHFIENLNYTQLEANKDSCTIKCNFSHQTLTRIVPLLSRYRLLSDAKAPSNLTYEGLSTKDFSASNDFLHALLYFKLPVYEGIELEKSCTEALAKLQSASPVAQIYDDLHDANSVSLIHEDRKFAQIKTNSQVQLDSAEQRNPRPSTKRLQAISVLKSYENRHHELEANHVIDKLTWQNLELVCGKSDPTRSVATSITNTSTELGKVLLQRRLISPINNVEILQKRAEVLKSLSNMSDSDFQRLKDLVSQLNDKGQENSFLSLWQNKDPFLVYYTDHEKINIPGLEQLSAWMNENRYAVYILKEKDKVMQMAITQGKEEIDSISIDLDNVAHQFGAEGLASALKNTLNILQTGVPFLVSTAVSIADLPWYASVPIAVASSVLQASGETPVMKETQLIRVMIHKKLNLIRDYLNTARSIHEILKKHDLLDKIKSCQNLNSISIDHSIQHSSFSLADFQKLLQVLDSYPNQMPSAVSLDMGKVVTTYRTLHRHKDKFIDALGGLAELDAVVSLASLCRNSPEEITNKFCQPTFVSAANNPEIEIKNFWNPIVGQHHTNTNSLPVIGKEIPKTLVLTGGNGLGKSNTAKTIVNSVIMAQSWGICPAAKVALTPFASIRTYLNVTDDAKQSRNQNESKRTCEIVGAVEKENKKGYSLTLFDEHFNGTEHQAAFLLSQIIVEHLAMNHPQNINILITHIHEIAELLSTERPDLFSAFKVTADTNKNGTVQAYHGLKPGISTQCTAFAILREEARQANLNPELIRRITAAEKAYNQQKNKT